MSQVADFDAKTPFVSQGNYSPAAIALMRALRDLRGRSGSIESSPQQVLAALRSVGFRRGASSFMTDEAETRLFVLALQRYVKAHGLKYPTCEDVLTVVKELGYVNSKAGDESNSGLPIDRRRLEFDTRMNATERRASSELSPQERLDLTETEHEFLDALKQLRERTGRDFASSEEILSVAWRLGFRPLDDFGVPKSWLNESERCELQVAFTTAIDAATRDSSEQFLTCRSVLDVVRSIGMQLD